VYDFRLVSDQGENRNEHGLIALSHNLLSQIGIWYIRVLGEMEEAPSARGRGLALLQSQ
jgi:hypothetical protein